MTLLYGFELLRQQAIPEIGAAARHFRHARTGAELLSLENDDENKVFGIILRTLPADDTGIAHILEHAVLAGSRKYPTKRAFWELIKSSLAGFINAYTRCDRTTYPIATPNLADFYNLMDVYLAAVFQPLLSATTFQQEGWHYELESNDGPLTFRGVVFNEMKGLYALQEFRLAEENLRALLPDTVYAHRLGGYPPDIPNLTYAQLQAFYRTHYHPSNALIYFSGDDPPDERLRRIDDTLREFQAPAVAASIPRPYRFDSPRRVTAAYPVSADAPSKCYMSIGWALPDEDHTPQLDLELELLAEALVRSEASPLREAVVGGGLAEDQALKPAEIRASDLDWGRTPNLVFGLKGVAQADTGRVEAVVVETLAKLVREGLNPNLVLAALNMVEFRLRENADGNAPRGLLIMERVLGGWLYGGDPIDALAFAGPLAALRQRLVEEPRYLEGLIDRYLVNNPHRATLVLTPDPTFDPQQQASEAERLAEARAAMSESDLAQIVENTRRLKAWQAAPDTPETLATLPVLKRSDLPRERRLLPCEPLDEAGSRGLFHDVKTNDLFYLDVGLDLHTLPEGDLELAAVLGRALFETGLPGETHLDLAQRIGRTTGGIRPELFISPVRGQAESTAWLFLRGKATVGLAPELLNILRDVLLSARLDDRQRIKQIVVEERARREANLAFDAFDLVPWRLGARFSEADWANEHARGLGQLFALRALEKALDDNWRDVHDRLEAMRARLVNRATLFGNVTVDADNWSRLRHEWSRFLEALPTETASRKPWTPAWTAGSEGLTFPGRVNYVGKGANIYALGHRPRAAGRAVRRYTTISWHMEQVRERGGAYGGACRFDPLSGNLIHLSWFDPQLMATLDVYDRSGAHLRQLELDDTELTKAIIGAFSELDAHQLPQAKGFTSLIDVLTNQTDEYLQTVRDETLATSPDDFAAFAEALDQVAERGTVVVLGSAEALAAANQQRGGNWLALTPVL